MKKLGLLCAALLLALVMVQPAAAQEDFVHRFKVGFVNEQFSEGDFVDFHLTGFDLRYSYAVHPNAAIAGDFGSAWGEPFGLNTNNQWYMGGLQFFPHVGENVEVYGMFLGGIDRISFGEGEGNSDTGGSLKVGGGLNLYPSRNVGFYAEVSYKSTWLFDSRQNVWLFGGGLIFRGGER